MSLTHPITVVKAGIEIADGLLDMLSHGHELLTFPAHLRSNSQMSTSGRRHPSRHRTKYESWLHGYPICKNNGRHSCDSVYLRYDS